MFLIYFILILGITASLMTLRHGRENRSGYESHKEDTFGLISMIILCTFFISIFIYGAIK